MGATATHRYFFLSMVPPKSFLLKCLVLDILFDSDTDNDRDAGDGGVDNRGPPAPSH